MKMPGGGTFEIQPGQFTDDSELAKHLLHSLLEKFDPEKGIQEQTNLLVLNTALHYKAWLKSGPFDRGNTCSGAFRAIIQSGVSNSDFEI